MGAGCTANRLDAYEFLDLRTRVRAGCLHCCLTALPLRRRYTAAMLPRCLAASPVQNPLLTTTTTTAAQPS
eukprot:899612-Heterocapsa_arctica.AAC.1